MANILGRGKDKSQAHPINLFFVEKDVYMHSVSEDELETLAGAGDGLWLTAFGALLGSFVSVLSTVETVTITDPGRHAVFVLAAWVSGFFAIIFGVKVCKDRQTRSKKMERYREASRQMAERNNRNQVGIIDATSES